MIAQRIFMFITLEDEEDTTKITIRENVGESEEDIIIRDDDEDIVSNTDSDND